MNKKYIGLLILIIGLTYNLDTKANYNYGRPADAFSTATITPSPSPTSTTIFKPEPPCPEGSTFCTAGINGSSCSITCYDPKVADCHISTCDGGQPCAVCNCI